MKGKEEEKEQKNERQEEQEKQEQQEEQGQRRWIWRDGVKRENAQGMQRRGEEWKNLPTEESCIFFYFSQWCNYGGGGQYLSREENGVKVLAKLPEPFHASRRLSSLLETPEGHRCGQYRIQRPRGLKWGAP